MFSKQALSTVPAGSRAGLVLSFVAAVGALSACSSMLHRSNDSGAPVAARPAVQREADAGPPMTSVEAAVAGAPDDNASVVTPAAPDRSAVNPSAPANYTVKRGDTLWGIANMFLRDPWLWPEIWQVNPQIENPHLIYPGDVLALAFGADGRPQITLTRGGGARLNPLLRSSELDGAIATIPYSAIAAFLERPTVLSKEQIAAAPRVLAFRDRHMIGGAGVETYIRGLQGGNVNSRYSVVHVGDAIRDPDDGALLGYQGVYTATALLLKPGEPAKAALIDSARETLEGDRLVTSDYDVPLNFIPRAPERDVKGRIISVIDAVTLIGQYKVVVINRGKRDGLEPGHVLAVEEAGEIVRDRTRKTLGGVSASQAFAPRVQLPEERSGTMLVFRVYDRMSYGLIVSATDPIRIADIVRKP
jgi:LysM repeat protein